MFNAGRKGKALAAFLMVLVMGFAVMQPSILLQAQGEDSSLLEIDPFLIEYLGEEFIRNEIRALEIFEQMQDFLGHNMDGRSDAYPDFFGGHLNP